MNQGCSRIASGLKSHTSDLDLYGLAVAFGRCSWCTGLLEKRR